MALQPTFQALAEVTRKFKIQLSTASREDKLNYEKQYSALVGVGGAPAQTSSTTTTLLLQEIGHLSTKLDTLTRTLELVQHRVESLTTDDEQKEFIVNSPNSFLRNETNPNYNQQKKMREYITTKLWPTHLSLGEYMDYKKFSKEKVIINR